MHIQKHTLAHTHTHTHTHIHRVSARHTHTHTHGKPRTHVEHHVATEVMWCVSNHPSGKRGPSSKQPQPTKPLGLFVCVSMCVCVCVCACGSLVVSLFTRPAYIIWPVS